jgi:hypothetical protein
VAAGRPDDVPDPGDAVANRYWKIGITRLATRPRPRRHGRVRRAGDERLLADDMTAASSAAIIGRAMQRRGADDDHVDVRQRQQLGG